MANEKGAEFYYNSSDSIGEFAAKTASNSSQYTTPKNVFTIHNYYADTDANYEYITPNTTSYYGGWASYDYHAIAKDKFYYKSSSSSAYSSFKFVHRLSAPLLKKKARKEGRDDCQAPFEYIVAGANSAVGGTGRKVKIYWDNYNNRTQVDVLDFSENKLFAKPQRGYGVFILLSGAGGGGGGGDNEYWGQGKPGGGGGGGGGTALMYFDAKKAYDLYPGSYLYISIGIHGIGGLGGSGFAAGSAGENSVAQFKNSSGTTLCTISCGGGKGGAGHSWDAAADSAGGAGGGVQTISDDDTCSTILKLLQSAAGGAGGAGKRGADGNSGGSISSGSWLIPFKDSWGKLDTFSDNNKTCYMGGGSAHNWQGGGGGGCGTGYKSSSSSELSNGHGMGGYGGGSNQAGLNGGDGFCGIFLNYIPGV